MHSSAPPPAPLPAQRFALLVGVNEYRAFDQATKTAMGMYDLRAPRNDVIAWFKFLRRMDVPAANIRVLTTPALTPEELDTDDEVICREATTAHMQDAAKWYLGISDQHGARGYGFVFLAGHGDFSSTMGYALFLADYKGTPVGNILNDTATEAGVAQLMWLLGLYGRRSPTTVVADVCRRSSVVIPATTANPPIDVDSVSTSDLVQVIEATGPGMASYERCFEGTWRGQFTWAAMSILRNWPTRRLSDRTPYVAIPAALLQQKIQTLLSVFNNPTQSQTPTLYQTMEAPKGSIPGPFMLPGVPARVYEFASDGLGHEFPAGTTDFKDADREDWLFLRVVHGSDGTITYYTSTKVWTGDKACTYEYSNGLTDFPTNFHMEWTSTIMGKPNENYTQKVFTASVANGTANTPIDGKPHWVGNSGYIEMWSDQNKNIYWRHKVQNTPGPNGNDGGFNNEPSILSSGSAAETMSAKNSSTEPAPGGIWRVWTDTMQ